MYVKILKSNHSWHKQSIGRDGNTIFFFKKSFFYDNDLSQNKQEQKGIYIYIYIFIYIRTKSCHYYQNILRKP